jgi:DNA polymerase-3 subunit beta
MNVETTSADFRRAIFLAGKVVERRSTIPILSMIRCHANGSFEATGTDLDMTLTATVARAPGPDADFCMQSPQHVIAAVAAAGGKSVAMAHENGKLRLSSDALEVTVDTLPADDFPMDHLRPLDEHFSATFSPANIAAIERVTGAVSTEETRYYLNGVRLKSVGPTTIQAQATDGHRLYLCDIELPDAKGELGESVIIPRKAVRLLIDLAKSAKDGVRLTIGSPAPANRVEGTAPERPGASRLRLSFAERAADISLISKLIDGTFPAVERVIPAGGDKQALFNVATIRRALAAVSGHSREVRAIKIAFDAPGSATISAAYLGIGLAASIKVPCEHSAAGLTVGFNGGYLDSIVNAARGEEVLFTMTDETAPTLVKNPADTAWTGVLMPMRVG